MLILFRFNFDKSIFLRPKAMTGTILGLNWHNWYFHCTGIMLANRYFHCTGIILA